MTNFRKKLYFFIILSFFTFLISAQTNVEIKKKEFKVEGKDSKELKEALKSVKKGDTFFEMGKGAFIHARTNYLDAREYNSTNPELNYKIGVCYLFTDDKHRAIEFLEYAYELKPEVAFDIFYVLGRAYHIALDFDKAIEYYNKFISTLSEKQIRNLTVDINQYITQCQNGKRLVSAPVSTNITNAGSNINSEFDDYSPVVNYKDSVMFFTSRRQHSKKAEESQTDYKFYEDIYFSVKEGGAWGPAKQLFKNKNVKKNTAVVGISKDANTILVYEGSENGGDIFFITKKKNKWTSPKPLPGKVNSKQRESSAFLSPDGNTLYFVSDRKKETLGGSDIFKSIKKENGKWEKPENLGAMINTKYDEEAVSIHPNGKVMYFSSKGHNSMGGYDIFKSEMDNNGAWGEARNMGYPINSADDDIFLTTIANGKNGYFTAIRSGGYGLKDIYKITIMTESKELMFESQERLLATVPGIGNNIYFDTPEKVAVATQIQITGRIVDAKTMGGIVASVEVLQDGNKVGSAQSSFDGNFKIKVNEVSDYKIEANANGYLFGGENVNTSDFAGQIANIEIKLSKAETGAKVVLKNVYFQPGRAILKEESYTELNKVYSMLMSNTNLRLEISGFTDNIGTIEANEQLSEARAKACVNYLVKKGIDKSRLVYKGYGLLQPVAPNSTPEGRAKNRRVEFKVL